MSEASVPDPMTVLPRNRRPRPCLAVGERSATFVPASEHVMAHNRWTAPTACGIERDTTSVTWNPAQVRCPDCLAAAESAPEAGS